MQQLVAILQRTTPHHNVLLGSTTYDNSLLSSTTCYNALLQTIPYSVLPRTTPYYSVLRHQIQICFVVLANIAWGFKILEWFPMQQQKDYIDSAEPCNAKQGYDHALSITEHELLISHPPIRNADFSHRRAFWVEKCQHFALRLSPKSSPNAAPGAKSHSSPLLFSPHLSCSVLYSTQTLRDSTLTLILTLNLNLLFALL